MLQLCPIIQRDFLSVKYIPIEQGYLVLGFRVYFITNVSAICLF